MAEVFPSRWQKPALNLLLLLFGILFFGFQGYQLYLMYRTNYLFERFGQEQMQRARSEVTALFEATSTKEALSRDSELGKVYLEQELSRIEKSYSMEAILILKPDGFLKFSTISGREYYLLNRPEGKLLLSEDIQSLRSVLKTNSVDLDLILIFSLQFPDLLAFQKSYLLSGFFLFSALFFGFYLFAQRWLKRFFDMDRLLQEQNRLAEFGRLSAGIAHDIRNPLGIIRLKVQELNEFHENDRETLSLLHHIDRAAQRINHTIGTLLVFQNAQKEAREKIAFEIMVEEVLRDFAADRERIKVEVQESSIRGRRDLLGRMLENLVRNGLDSAPSGAKVVIRGQVVPEGYILEIEDDGLGIQEPDRIFEPFYTTKNYGTGLGLTVVMDAVQAHKGRIEIINPGSQGTLFRIHLPQE